MPNNFFIFSDAIPNSGELNPKNLIDLIKSWDEKVYANVSISAFNIGNKKAEALLHRITCEMKGYYFYISINKITDALAQFIVLIQFKQKGPSWSEPYEDGSGLGTVITLNYAIYDEDDLFFGVLGIDFLYSDL